MTVTSSEANHMGMILKTTRCTADLLRGLPADRGQHPVILPTLA